MHLILTVLYGKVYLCSGSLCAVGHFVPEHTKLQLSGVRNIILWKPLAGPTGSSYAQAWCSTWYIAYCAQSKQQQHASQLWALLLPRFFSLDQVQAVASLKAVGNALTTIFIRQRASSSMLYSCSALHNPWCL